MKTSTLPSWLKQTDSATLPAYSTSRSGKDYLEKTLGHIRRILAEDACSWTVSGSRGLLQRMDTPVKLVGILALIIAASLTRSIPFLLFLNAVILSVALKSGITCRAFGLRVWIPTILFAGLAVLPGMFSWITPGEPLVILYAGVHEQIGPFSIPADLAFTRQGVQAALFVVLRAAASLGLATLLIRTTRWSLITKALAKFGLPAEVITVLDLTYRYIYMFLMLLTDYLMGRRSRLVGLESESGKLSWIGGTISAFLRLTLEHSQELYYAMQSRGYCGDHYAEARIQIRAIDGFFLVIVVVLCYCAVGGTFDARIFTI